MDATSTVTESRAISKLPSEIVSHIFLYLSGGFRLYDIIRLCQVCRVWLPIAQTILYRSVTIYNSKIRVFTRSMEENEYLAPLIKHLALDRSNTRTDWLYINRILRVLSPHKALRSFHLPATTRISPKDIEVIQSVSLLSFLGHLDVDINIFSSLHAIKQFIASFPQIHTLDVNDEFGRDVEGEWFDESASDAPIEFPPSIRRL